MAYEIVQLARDEEGSRVWMQRYKELRLHALQSDPKAFGSSYEREVAFKDEEWLKRLRNPDAITLVALQEDGELIGTLTTMHLLCEPQDIVIPGTTPEASPLSHDGPSPLHYRVFGMFTKAEHRGQGIGKALLAAAVKCGQDHAARLARPYVGTLVTESCNDTAKGLYEKAGFEPVKTVEFMLEYQRTLVVYQYRPIKVEGN